MSEIADARNKKRAKWTIMVYMAGGKDATNAARDSLLRMKQVGSSENINLLAQLDSGREGGPTKRYRLKQYEWADKTRELLNSLNTQKALKRVFKKFLESESPVARSSSKAFGKAKQTKDVAFLSEALRSIVVGEKGETFGHFLDQVLIGEPKNLLLKGMSNREIVKKFMDDPEFMRSLVLDCALEPDKVKPAKGERELGQTESGDPEVFRSFLRWGLETKEYQADHTMVIIWGHGDGFSLAWDAPPPKKPPAQISQVRAVPPSSRPDDHLTTVELGEALKIGGKPIDIVGFNACLMGTVEVYHQIRGAVTIAIGSEGLTPMASWPYDRILTKLEAVLKRRPMGSEELANVIVDEYGNEYRAEFQRKGDDGIDLSASRLSDTQDVVMALRILVGLLRVEMPNRDRMVLNAVMAAQFKAQSYFDDDYADLYDFCQILGEYCATHESIRRACRGVMDAVKAYEGGTAKANERGMVRSLVREGGTVQFSNGVSIYFPLDHPIMKKYAKLDFIEETGWLQFLRDYLKLAGRSEAAQSKTA